MANFEADVDKSSENFMKANRPEGQIIYIANRIQQVLMISWEDITQLLFMSADDLGWGRLTNKDIMDIGCGDGSRSTKAIIDVFPTVRRVIAMDSESEKIRGAFGNTCPSKVFYMRADILHSSTFKGYEGSMHAIFSDFCFNDFDDHETAFRNVYDLLTPGGSAAIRFPLKIPIYDWIKEVYAKWMPGVTPWAPRTQVENLPEHYYRQMFTRLGFTIRRCETCDMHFKIGSYANLKRSLAGCEEWSSVIRPELLFPFNEDAYARSLKYCSVSSAGMCSMKAETLLAFLIKPNDQ
ncbi:methyltranfer_dom domain-containing protein [Caerostris extrusa]|uniref:Methyltranfer_dom domain-containing protein n=1 Tax=Caerostris extrusa TaxID=172846 RepID=A0AAV4TUG8_CAEEX|nr:methyltranfer_dom domain-containing protein [Caerostris extrusa]